MKFIVETKICAGWFEAESPEGAKQIAQQQTADPVIGVYPLTEWIAQHYDCLAKCQKN
jgi:hypothetical protein